MVMLGSLQNATALSAEQVKLPFEAVVVFLVVVLPRLPSQVQVIGTPLSAGVIAPLIAPNPLGLLVKAIELTVQVGVVPACVMVNDWPWMVMVPLRVLLVLFGITANAIVPDPVPLVDPTSIKAPPAAVHGQPARVDIVAVPAPPVAEND